MQNHRTCEHKMVYGTGIEKGFPDKEAIRSTELTEAITQNFWMLET